MHYSAAIVQPNFGHYKITDSALALRMVQKGLQSRACVCCQEHEGLAFATGTRGTGAGDRVLGTCNTISSRPDICLQW